MYESLLPFSGELWKIENSHAFTGNLLTSRLKSLFIQAARDADIQLDSQKIKILLELKPYRLFMVFLLSALLLPSIFILGFDLVYAKGGLDSSNVNVSALCMLLGMLVAYTICIYYAKDHFNLTISNLSKSVSLAHVFFALLTGFIFAIVAIQVMLLLPPPDGFQSSTLELLSGTRFSRLVVILFVAILAPLVEEFIFRSYIFDAFRQKYSFFVTALISSLLFTLPHMAEYYVYWPAGLLIFTLGFLLAFFRKRHESLLPCIALHASYNCTVLLLFFAANAS